MELKRTLEEEIRETPIWIKGVLNFCMYIIASHIVGALWYFFAIQRMMVCRHSACRKDDGCDNRIFGCHDHHLFRNTTILNDLCPVSVSDNSSDTMHFDFGIFVTVLQFGVVGSTNYFQKFLSCFWWGLRNLSSLGSNLEPSVDGWENLYTVSISITGLLLFLYLIGNLQMPAFKFQNMEESVLKTICRHLQPKKYNRYDNIIQKGDPIQMFFIVEGAIALEGCVKGAGESYGGELLVWPFSTSFPDRVPTTAAESVKANTTVVEALVLKASDMKSVAIEFRKHFIKNYGRLLQNLVNCVSPISTTLAPSSSEAVLKFFTEEELEEATRNCSDDDYVNEEGYGIFYHSKLHGRDVVIKRCNSTTTTGEQYIQSQRLVQEAFVLSEFRHKNVVRLLGCCLATKWPIMVYDYDGTYAWTLSQHIHVKIPALYSLESRMKIAADTAGALACLHSMYVIHRDVRTENILIDRTTYIARVSGFGFSRLLHEDEDEMEDDVSTLPETSVYLDPEYLKSHVLTEKSDVYGFGVVLVELLTRRKPVSYHRPEGSLANKFVCSVQEGRLNQILDYKLMKDELSFEIAKKVSELAVTCLRSRGEERPSMEKVAVELEAVVQTIINSTKA
ncbi:hypothetical protein D8674_023141 [Pyrus ussuriensis x Pyrus communis]|uniref:Uncharacterized protein n=1 Tax=Pyrus ussuriensis x Pyrus communis TaxID=2448454 RepID=A0A5N5GP73_9ROSA|nr:hypothetical protein D8674_023141 [Pyrus ussuriensis x Pyrus communis]